MVCPAGKAGPAGRKQPCSAVAVDGTRFARMVFYFVRTKTPTLASLQEGQAELVPAVCIFCSKASVRVNVITEKRNWR